MAHRSYGCTKIRKKPLVSFEVLNLATVEFRRHRSHRYEYVAPEATVIPSGTQDKGLAASRFPFKLSCVAS